MKISGVVVWYNPTAEEVNNIKSYIDELNSLFIVDNSDISNLSLLDELGNKQKINYIPNYENLGIAKALNIGCEKAITEKNEWILTMDQDSSFNNNFDTFLTSIKDKLSKNEKIAIFAPKTSILKNGGYKNKVITSGNLVQLKAWREVDGFQEDFFIDEVDHDFSFRISKKGYSIYQFNNVIMKPKLGDSKSFEIFGKKIFSSMNHGYIRKYYITRNRFEMIQRYPEIKKEYLNAIMRDFIKMVLIEKNKFLKVKYCLKGYLDYKKQKFGKIK
ncbi:MAG: glycosyltransferase [Fusobacteriaceae bacterium]